MTHTRNLIGALALVGLALAACSDDEASSITTPGAAQTTAAPATTQGADASTTTAAAAPEPNQVDITLSDFVIDMPAEIPAGYTRLTATNAGAVEHHLILARLHDGVTFDQLLGTFATDQAAAEKMIDYAGGPNGVVPGATGSVEVNIEAGEYVAICVIPGADGLPHAAHGMIAHVTVTGDAPPANLSSLDVEATVSLTDFDFTISDGFDGQGRVLVTNNAPQAHEIAVTRVGEGGSLDEYMALLADPSTATPEIAARYSGAGGLTPIASGHSAIVEFNLDPGQYIFLCFVADSTDGAPHFVHHMVKVVTIP
jgi:uncharacterized cupredoxin-like copper-binding protein